MKNTIKNLIYRSFALVASFPITFTVPSPATLDISKITVPQKPVVENQSEEIANITLDTKNPQILVITEKQIFVKTVESNFDQETRVANEQNSKRIALRNTVARESTRTVKSVSVNPDLAAKRALVKRAAAAYGIPWQVLEAVWQVETGKSWDTGRSSSAGASGPMQFMPGTWRKYATDGDGNGTADITSANDAVYAAAKYLAASGASSGQIDRALYAYNHSSSYVAKVKGIASGIQE